MSSPAYLTRIGPLDGRDGASRAIYLALDADGQELASRTESPPDDVAAIRGLAAAVAPHAPCCALDLAKVGAQLGFDVADLPPRAAEERAVSACLASAPDHLFTTRAALRELCAAAADYHRAQPWTKLAILRRFRAKETVRVSNGAVLSETNFLLQVHAGHGPDGPRLHVEVEDSRRVLRASSPLRVEVTLTTEPGPIAAAVNDAYGAYLWPRITATKGEKLEVPEDSHALPLIAAMRAAVDHVRGGSGRGRASTGSLVCELEVDFTTSIPLAPLPIGKEQGPFDMRVVGRLTAHALAAQVPLPRYDDYVCVVLDRDDRQTASAMDLFDQTAAMLRGSLPDGFKEVYDTAVSVEHFVARWMRAEHMARMLEHNALPEESLQPLDADLPPFALRVLLFGSHQCEAFFVDFAPGLVRSQREKARDLERLRKTGEAEEGEEREAGNEKSATRAAVAKAPRPIVGTWRDGLAYLPEPLPPEWSVGERRASGAVAIAAGALTVVLTVERADGRRYVKVYFGEHPEGRPVTREEARDVYQELVGCGRFAEMTLVATDAEHVSLAGARLYTAPLARARPSTATPAKRSPSEAAALIERAKGPIGEAIAQARDERGSLRDYCVILDAKKPVGGLDGVVLTRAMIEKLFVTPESDPFHIRARFEEPRPEGECVVFVKHPDGIEEIHVSLEGVTWTPEAEA